MRGFFMQLCLAQILPNRWRGLWRDSRYSAAGALPFCTEKYEMSLASISGKLNGASKGWSGLVLTWSSLNSIWQMQWKACYKPSTGCSSSICSKEIQCILHQTRIVFFIALFFLALSLLLSICSSLFSRSSSDDSYCSVCTYFIFIWHFFRWPSRCNFPQWQ